MSHAVQSVIVIAMAPCVFAGIIYQCRASIAELRKQSAQLPVRENISYRVLDYPTAVDTNLAPATATSTLLDWQIAA